jgi:hypothetical protein
MINKINKERRRSMNATPTQHSNKNQWQGAHADQAVYSSQSIEKLQYFEISFDGNKNKRTKTMQTNDLWQF